MSDNPGGMAADGAGGQEADGGFSRWLEAWLSGFNAHRDSPDLTEDGFALLAAAQRAWEGSGGQRAKRVIAALGPWAAGSQTKPDRAESLDQNESSGGSP